MQDQQGPYRSIASAERRGYLRARAADQLRMRRLIRWLRRAALFVILLGGITAALAAIGALVWSFTAHEITPDEQLWDGRIARDGITLDEAALIPASDAARTNSDLAALPLVEQVHQLTAWAHTNAILQTQRAHAQAQRAHASQWRIYALGAASLSVMLLCIAYLVRGPRAQLEPPPPA